MRVVAGTLRGRPIVAPSGRTTRPTTDRTREAIFNALASMDAIMGAKVVDLFSGSGALGIEALSRGAETCTFVEDNGAALDAIKANVKRLELESRSSVIAGRSEVVVKTLRDIGLVLADPPYEYGQMNELLDSLGSALSPEGVVVIESGSKLEAVSSESHSWKVIREKRYGRTWVTFLQRI